MNPNIPFSMTNSIKNLTSEVIRDVEKVDPVLLIPTPDEIPDERVAESLFIKSISSMTQVDREYAYDDVHAIPLKEDQDPALIEQSLKRLEYETEIREDNQAYQLAKLSNPAYVYNRDFRLSFLRTDRFDAAKAAFRMVRHFQIKMELFGKERLGRDIVQDDFDEDDITVLNEGVVQLLPTKDRGGRAILLFGPFGGNPVALDPQRRLRRIFYLLMLASRETRSVVGLVSCMGNNKTEKDREVSIDGAWMAPRVLLGIPIHLSAVHLGYDSEMWTPLESVMKMSSDDDYRIRLRKFQGSTKEWLMSLQSYGILPDQVPLRDDGTIEQSEYQQLLRNHRVKERKHYPTIPHIKSPGPFDVVFGKGSRYQEHEGNVRLRRLIADCRKTYDKTDRGKKYIVIQEILDTVKLYSGLFLKEDGEEGWIVVDDEAAAKKIGNVFRTMRSQDKKIL